MADNSLDMTFSWASPPTTSPLQAQNRTLQAWTAVGSPQYPHAGFDPDMPLAVARKAAGYSGLGGLAGLFGIGSASDSLLAWQQAHPVASLALKAVVTADLVALGYHGYKRNGDNTGWGLAWGLGGIFFWPILTPIMLIQGFGKRKGR
jgi:hypothetical protein